jgi:Zn-dependent M28 family amino/carboxypeptidase
LAVERAATRGAAAVLSVTGDENTIRRRGSYSLYAVGQAVPCLLVSTATADRLLRAAGRSLDSAAAVGEPFLAGVTVRVSVPLTGPVKTQGRNVLGVLPGTDPSRTDQVLILGAHFDHLGRDPDGTLYPGAIDDASGVAVLLEVARLWHEQGFRPRINVLFAAWDAEEAGLLGSAYYVQHPRYPLQQTVAMIQLDCVGGGQGNVLATTQDVRGLHSALLESASWLNLRMGMLSDSGGSDHAPFSELGVPAVMLIWADVTSVIHVPTDTPDAVRVDNLCQTGVIVDLTLMRLSSGEGW